MSPGLSWVALALIGAGAIASPRDGNEKPRSLLEAERARSGQRLRTARLEFARVVPAINQSEPPHTYYYTWRCADDGILVTNHGGEDGAVVRDGRGGPAEGNIDGPQTGLLKDGVIWQRGRNTPLAYEWGVDRADFWAIHDVRQLGLDPGTPFGNFDERVKAVGKPVEYSETVQGDGLYRVDCKVEGGAVAWWIDPRRDWSVVKTAAFVNGVQVGEMRFALKEFDGYWFPVSVERVRIGAGQTEPEPFLTLLDAEFNQPQHPLEFTPADVGLEVGMPVYDMRSDTAEIEYWDGERTVSLDEFQLRLEQGEFKIGPTMLRETARRTARRERSALLQAANGTSPAKDHRRPTSTRESEWESYTRRFVTAYELDQTQSQKAWAILYEVQARAAAMILKIEPKLLEIAQKEAVDLQSTSSQPVESRQSTEPSEAERARSRLLEPVDALFVSTLKPRLFKLPTRAQIESAVNSARAIGDLAPNSVPEEAGRLSNSTTQPAPP